MLLLGEALFGDLDRDCVDARCEGRGLRVMLLLVSDRRGAGRTEFSVSVLTFRAAAAGTTKSVKFWAGSAK